MLANKQFKGKKKDVAFSTFKLLVVALRLVSDKNLKTACFYEEPTVCFSFLQNPELFTEAKNLLKDGVRASQQPISTFFFFPQQGEKTGNEKPW